jgi:hypothetical protein
VHTRLGSGSQENLHEDKKPRKSKSNPHPTLTPKQKKENRAISRIRVDIEHLIGDMKIFQIPAIKFRNHIESF